MSTPTDREIVLARHFAAPPDLVFAALTTPDLLRRWYGARGWNLVSCEIDLRVGGAWRYVSQGPGGERMAQSGVYRVVDAPRLLVSTERFDDQSYEGESVVRHHLTERDGGTKLTTTVRYASQAARDTVMRYPMARGVGESYERLDVLLAESLASPEERIEERNL
ncbi:MAG TPA: SRPBCC family protein [Jiangellaceae bacterium]